MNNELRRPTIYEAIKNAVLDGLAMVRELEEQHRYISPYYDFPNMSEVFGWPSFSKNIRELAPLDYTQAFEKGFLGDRPSARDLQSWQHFIELARSDQYLSEYWADDEFSSVADRLPDMKEFVEEYYPLQTIKELINRYIHVTNQKTFVESLFKPIYLEWERATFSPTLFFDAFVPIIFLKFSFDELEFNENMAIVKMDERFQLARNTQLSTGMSAHQIVISAATHALVLKGWQVSNNCLRERIRSLYDADAYSEVIDRVDRLFAALRAVAKVETGYSQIIASPNGWANSWVASLIPVYVTSIKAYPDRFEDFKWFQEPVWLDACICKSAYDIYEKLSLSQSKKLSLATKRFNRAFLRSDEEDSILDITIGLESLLVNDTKSEITYKLKMRLAALCKIEPHSRYTPTEVFLLCDRIYDFRSAVVHGSDKLEKKRVISLKEKEVIPTVALGIDLLAFAIQLLCRNSQYLDPKNIDFYLLDTDKPSEDSRTRN